ncbi:D-3-phosphoglycerate dehydrogenase [Planococcus halocryophilus Or1]|uniref:D-3-phosphoglycerate dehydrogenase n=1 Tax=Planococcus halocryophilus TaxID=1215089 RepID=UPI0002B885D4|nr:D-3-phosphoglycerate dehydrogenase [Planococcus halocryophilus]EMF46729.1 D-3-phosphoglycerate dehydrogenase [Planococcus halocryophilus Or1]
MKYKVLLTDYEFENLKYEEEVFAKSGLDIEFIKAQCKTEEEVIKAAEYADAILNQYAPLSRRVIESLRNTKIISRYGVGVNTIDVEAAKEKGIIITNVPDYGMEEVSNHALALLLSWARKVTLLNNEVKKGIGISKFLCQFIALISRQWEFLDSVGFQESLLKKLNH